MVVKFFFFLGFKSFIIVLTLNHKIRRLQRNKTYGFKR